MKCSEKCIHQYFCKFKEEGSNCDYYEEERPHGEWVRAFNMDKATVCSECGEEAWYKEYCGWVTKSNFCPNCGSDNRKRGETNEN